MWIIVINKCSSTWLLGGALKTVRDVGMFCYSDNTHLIDARHRPVFGAIQNKTAILIPRAPHPQRGPAELSQQQAPEEGWTFPLLPWGSTRVLQAFWGEWVGAAGRLSHSWILLTWTGDPGFPDLSSPISISVSEKSRAQQWAIYLIVLSSHSPSPASFLLLQSDSPSPASFPPCQHESSSHILPFPFSSSH